MPTLRRNVLARILVVATMGLTVGVVAVVTPAQAATSPATYAKRAATSEAALQRWFGTDTGQSRYFTQDPPFHAIFFANLLQLGTTGGSARYVDAMASYERQARQRYYDASTGLFRFGGQNTPVKLLEQAAMVRIQAMLAWSPEKWHLLT